MAQFNTKFEKVIENKDKEISLFLPHEY